ncbi:hypothetical protein [Streptomyces sp. NPDC048295]|uniref:hypothetical protein n=1 Tax=Streptomyces sp. NPDC048295 TaxID=3154617 RepID=UPI003447C21F
MVDLWTADADARIVASRASALTGIRDRRDNTVVLARRPDDAPSLVSCIGGYQFRGEMADERITALNAFGITFDGRLSAARQ